MHKVALMALKGYREWTESLGPRREHIIQKTQARLHETLWRSFTSIGALPHHFRYDYLIALTNNVSAEFIRKAVDKIRRVSPVEVEFCEGTGETPMEAYKNCGRASGLGGEVAVVGHMDVVNSTDTTKVNGPLYVYRQVQDLLKQATDFCRDVGCMVFYLGGDNIMLFLPTPKAAYELYGYLNADLRIGIGIAKRPYNAFVKATRGLDALRHRGATGVKLVK
ncbi:GTP cyclohydrolase IIa [Pyrobaculum sp. 3827-6]|uniref:GTP cyclohydrolase IIa n=1 Tax=Pyrobaculum sp. 3827-6 TaxID=2983604 RepID=UPI0021D81909|nr:GTP cyclohydrolase IIa [Pyrobaculum sp. 3827-6]MCU7787423.1 GTP cyclohydrolase IIa [Pyrobaculum sp. 3827-6]